MAFHEGRDRATNPNVKFIEDGIALDERNLVPEDHPDNRRCATLGTSTDCKEPVSATEATEIDLLIKDGENVNAGFDEVENPADETFSLHCDDQHDPSGDGADLPRPRPDAGRVGRAG